MGLNLVCLSPLQGHGSLIHAQTLCDDRRITLPTSLVEFLNRAQFSYSVLKCASLLCNIMVTLAGKTKGVSDITTQNFTCIIRDDQ